MPITILSVGKKNSPWLEQGITVYTQRLRRPYLADWHLLPHQPAAAKAVMDESNRILDKIHPQDFVILLDESGQQLDSPQLSQALTTVLNRSQPITIVIGGAYGVNRAVKTRANLIWSLSPLVFPHQLVRLLVSEQLYRAQSIAFNEPYHHS